ncbi:MAG: hypothetical protein QM706_13275 [Nitrospira sp.]
MHRIEGIVERYEVVKGPASIVGGAANPGGIVNRITKTPQRSNFTTVEANFGSYDFYRGLIDTNGILPKYESIRGRLVFAVEEGGELYRLHTGQTIYGGSFCRIRFIQRRGQIVAGGVVSVLRGCQLSGLAIVD